MTGDDDDNDKWTYDYATYYVYNAVQVSTQYTFNQISHLRLTVVMTDDDDDND